MADIKQCMRCKVFKSHDDFANDKSRKDGKQKMCRSCFYDYFHPGGIHRRYLYTQTTITEYKYGWSKWGGANQGAVKETLTPEWNCQACGSKLTNELPAYLFEIQNREFIRICSKCEHLAFWKRIETFQELIDLVRV